MKRKLIWIVVIALVVIFAGMQLIPLNRTNPPITREVRWDTPQTRALAQRACFDCHSNETIWPWDAYIAPASLLITGHVSEGRSRLNFSAWDQPNADFEELRGVIQEGEMPPWDYLMMHPNARLTDAEKGQLIAGLQATFLQDPPILRQRRPRP